MSLICADGVDGAGVDVADLRAHDRRPVVERRRRARRPASGPGRPRPSARSPRCRRRGSAAHGRSCRAAAPPRARGPAGHPTTPPSSRPIRPGRAPRAARRPDPVKLAICAPVTNPTDACRRQAEQVGRPRPGDLLDDGRGGPEDVQPRVLVPRAGQPVGRQRRRRRASDDEPEEPAATRGDHPGLGRRGQIRATTRAASCGPSGSGPPSASRSCARSAAGRTGRSGRPSR